TVSGTSAVDLVSNTLTNNTTSGAQNSEVLSIGGSGTTESGLTINYTGTVAGGLTAGIIVQGTSTGTIATAINLTDAEIGTGIDLGTNDLVGTTAVINFSNFDVASTGQLTFTGVATDITTASGESLTLEGAGAGEVIVNDSLQVATLGTTGTTALCRNASNQLATCNSGVSAATLQSAYDNGNTISTTGPGARDIAFTLTDQTTDSNFTVSIASGSTSTASITRANGGVAEAAPAQLLLLDNADINVAVADGLKITSSGAGGLTDAIDLSGSNITNAINLGTNKILGTTAVIDFSNFDVASTGQLTFTGVATDITTASGEDLTLQAAGAGVLQLSDNTTITGTLTMSGATTDITTPSGENLTLTAAGAGIIELSDTVDVAANTIQGTTAVINFSNFDVSSAGNITVAASQGLDTNAAGTLNIGTTNANLIAINTDVNMTFGGTENLAITSDGVGGSSDSLTIAVTPSASAGTLRGIVLSQASSTNTNPLDTALEINNADDSAAIGTGLLVQSTGGGSITTGIDLAATQIGTGISLGANDITGTTAVINFSNFDVASTGQLTFTGVATDINTASGESLTLEGTGAGEVIVNDTLQVVTLGANTGATGICRNSSNQISSCVSNPDSVTLQQAYNASTSPEITLDATRGAVTIRDNSTPIGANLFEVQNNAGSTTYLGVTTSATTVTGNLLPGADDQYNLGSSSARWQDLYLGPTSLHLYSTATETTTARDWKLNIQETDGATEGNLRLFEGTNEYLTVTKQGKVGIGTSNPTGKLEVIVPSTSGSVNDDPTSGMLSQSGLGNFNAAQSVDDNTTTTGWHTDSSTPGAYLKMDFGSGNDKDMVKARMYVGSGAVDYAGNYTVEYSDNDSTWNTATTNFTPTFRNAWYEKSWTSVGPHRYWRFRLTNTPSGGPYITELEMYRAGGVI
ncbi:MAG TPA: discoidin domain-containing protein, partial [Anaerolineales bacterium]